MSTQIKEVCGEQADDPQSAEMKKLLLLGMIKEQQQSVLVNAVMDCM